MDKTTLISAKIDADLKHKAEQIFREIGLTPTQAITLFYKQVDLQHIVYPLFQMRSQEKRWKMPGNVVISKASTAWRASLETWKTDEDFFK